MRAVFRADASVQMGAGHVRRCLSLASALLKADCEVMFVCIQQPGDLLAEIADRGFEVRQLSGIGSWSEDARATSEIIATEAGTADWLIVDHYGLDERWEKAMRSRAHRLLAIDDLAERPHECDALLDQNADDSCYEHYRQRLPARARLLLGPQFALVAPEFGRLRSVALNRRGGPVVRLLVSMGGTDPQNDTSVALAGIGRSRFAATPVDVVVGSANPHRAEVERCCGRLAECELHVQTSRMAELMARADLGITGAGSTTWERCALGLGGLVVVQSADQAPIARAVTRAGALRALWRTEHTGAQDYARELDGIDAVELSKMSAAAASMADGGGAERVAGALLSWTGG